MTLEELETYNNTLKAQIGGDRLNAYEDKKIDNYAFMFDIMGGHDGIAKLKAFAADYANQNAGWNAVEKLLPQGLTGNQQTVYIIMATYVDKVMRPLLSLAYSVSSSRAGGDGNKHDPSPADCKIELQMMLEDAGTGMTADEFIKLMENGGDQTGYDEEDTTVGPELLDLSSIWWLYKICMSNGQGNLGSDPDPDEPVEPDTTSAQVILFNK